MQLLEEFLPTDKLTYSNILAFDEVAAHDVNWNAKSIAWHNHVEDNKHKQEYVSLSQRFSHGSIRPYKGRCPNQSDIACS